MSKKDRWTREQYDFYKQQVVPLLKQKISVKTISEKLGISVFKINKIADKEGLKIAQKRHKWTEDRYIKLYKQAKPYLNAGVTIRCIAKRFKVYPYRITEAIKFCKEKRPQLTQKDNSVNELLDSCGHSIEFDSKMNWRKFNVEIRLLSCPLDKFKCKTIKCSAIQEIQEYLEEFCPLNEFILQFGDKNNEMFIYINDIKRPLDEKVIYRLFY